MRDAVLSRSDAVDVIVMAAAVADYTPVTRAPQKIAKNPDTSEVLTLTLRRTPDILAELGQRRVTKGAGPVLIGFAAETEQVVEHARAKREKKHVDLIVANDVSRSDAGFDVDTNAVTLVGPDGEESVPKLAKSQVAARILDRVEQLLSGSRSPQGTSPVRR
jgi:phosphopantothenoylcysteine decarboxylase/phosphopantothenate--cysteine ligase